MVNASESKGSEPVATDERGDSRRRRTDGQGSPGRVPAGTGGLTRPQEVGLLLLAGVLLLAALLRVAGIL